MKGYEYQSHFAKLYVAEGRAKGLLEGLAQGRTEGLTEGFIKGRTEGFVEGRIKGLTEGLTEGVARGRVEEAACAVVMVFRARGIAVSDVERERILAQNDPERLERWLEKAAVASSVAEVLDELN